MFNSLWRSCGHPFPWTSWLSRTPGTSWYMQPQRLSPAILMSPTERFWTVGSKVIRLRAAEPLHLTASTALLYQTHSQLISFVHLIITFDAVRVVVLLGDWCKVSLECGGKPLGFYPFLYCSTFNLFLVFTSPTVMCNAFLVISHYFFQNREMTLFCPIQSCLKHYLNYLFSFWAGVSMHTFVLLACFSDKRECVFLCVCVCVCRGFYLCVDQLDF